MYQCVDGDVVHDDRLGEVVTIVELINPQAEELQVVERRGNLDAQVLDLTDDSRKVRPGSLFVAVKGGQVDGHNFLSAAAKAGASALVVEDPCSLDPEEAGGQGKPGSSPALLRVRNSRRAVGLLAGRFYGDPSSCLGMIGVTGTNGKTTVTYLCKAVLEAAGRRVGLIGTVGHQVGSEHVPASHTTPGAVEFHGLLARMVRAGLDSVVMEVSSHALALDRTVGCEFDLAVYTNLTQDHLDFHADLEDYFQAKLKLFSNLSSTGGKLHPKRSIVNVDDPNGRRVCEASRVPFWTYSIRGASDIRAEQVRLTMEGTRFLAVTPSGRFDVISRLVGEHNVYNMLAAIGVGLHEGLPPEVIVRGLQGVTNIPGRFERVEMGQPFTVVVDYAHTEDALLRVLSAAQGLKTGRIITVFGCGGDRDRDKRPKMGRVAALLSEVVYLTSDNPRTEDPAAILGEVEVGVREEGDRKQGTCFRYEVIPDRRAAIQTALGEAKAGDMVLIAGKGHEDYQIIGTQRHHFDDREVARAALQAIKT